jgi:2-C-methyl-D-erythritol 4-phosphate cytidylyltransferase
MCYEKYYLVVPASGQGARMQTQIPKQYLMLNNGKTILDQALETLLSIDKINGLVVAISANDQTFKRSVFAQHSKLLNTVTGGKLRVNSVLNALKSLKNIAKPNDWILVHDAARPCVCTQDINNLISQLSKHPVGGLLGIPVVDTLKKTQKNVITKTINRTQLWQAQTPQMYRFSVLQNALESAIKAKIDITDESSAIEHQGLESLIITGSKYNLKITTPEDLNLANFYLSL